eukprot:3733769-Pleurochrysis_carterae.AAC.1
MPSKVILHDPSSPEKPEKARYTAKTNFKCAESVPAQAAISLRPNTSCNQSFGCFIRGTSSPFLPKGNGISKVICTKPPSAKL